MSTGTGFPEFSGDDALSNVTRRPLTPQLVDEHGNQTFYGTTDNLDPSGNFPIDSRIVEFIEYGVLNGSFSRPPPDPYHDITDINPLPDWTGPVSVSGGAITAQWATDATYPSGHALRFTVNGGAALDEAYFEQIVPIGGTLSRAIDHGPRMVFRGVSASTPAAFQGTLAARYLDATGAAIGLGASTVQTVDTSITRVLAFPSIDDDSPPATARFLRIRIGVKRNTAAATDTAVLDITDVRIDTGRPYVLVTDFDSAQAGVISQASGVLSIAAAGAVELVIDSTANNAVHPSGGTFWVPEGAGPSTPASGYHAIYAKSADSKLYSKSDGGVEYKLNNVIGTDVQAWDADLNTLAAATVTSGGTFTPSLDYGTTPATSWAVITALGWYTRLLDRVLFNFIYQGVPTNGAGAGNLTLSGLPVTAKSTASSASEFAIGIQGYTKANYTMVVGRVVQNTATAIFQASGSGQAIANLAVGDIPSLGTVLITGGGHYPI